MIRAIRRTLMLIPLLAAALILAGGPTVSAAEGVTGAERLQLLQGSSWVDRTKPTAPCGPGGTDIPNGTPEENGKHIFDYFVGKGYKPFQAAGIIGNMMVESGLLPQRLQSTPPDRITPAESLSEGQLDDTDLGWGLVQFTNPGKYIRYAKAPFMKRNDPPYNYANPLGTQLDFISAQLEGGTHIPEKEAGDDVKATTTIEDAVRAFQGNLKVGGQYRGYERPADQSGSILLRIRYAKAALTDYGSGATTGDVAAIISTSDSSSCADPEAAPSSPGWAWPARSNLNDGNCWDVYVSGLGRHAGMDINTSAGGVAAYAAHSGTVVRVVSGIGGFSESQPAGNHVIIKTDTDPALYIGYQHLSSVAVKEGQKITSTNTKVGTVGKTGRVYVNSSVGHLHFTVAVRETLGSYSDNSATRDPMTYLPKPAPDGYKCVGGSGSNA